MSTDYEYLGLPWEQAEKLLADAWNSYEMTDPAVENAQELLAGQDATTRADVIDRCALRDPAKLARFSGNQWLVDLRIQLERIVPTPLCFICETRPVRRTTGMPICLSCADTYPDDELIRRDLERRTKEPA